MPDTPETGDWYHPDATTFGDRLAGAREAAGMSQAELARKLGIKQKTLRAWEEDLSEPRANRLSMLSGLLNVSLVWLMTGEGDGPQPAMTAERSDLLHEVRRLRADASKLADRLRLLEGRLMDDAGPGL